jgi:hypothetical protein
MSNEINNVSPLERYVALRTIRDNAYYERPLTYNSLDILEDIPGPARGSALWFSDALPSSAIFAKDPNIRKEQINRAISKTKETRVSANNTTDQALRNAAVLGVTGVPSAAAISTLFRILNPRSPLGRGGLRSPITPSRSIKNIKKYPSYRKKLIKEILSDSYKGGLLSAGTGALTPILSGTTKPSDGAFEEAGKLLQDKPVLTALPPVDIIAALENQKKPSTLKNIAIGTGVGGLLGAAGSFIPPTLNLPSRLLSGLLKLKSPVKGIVKDYAQGAKQNLLLNSAIVGGTGGAGGYFYSKYRDNEQAANNQFK